MENWKSIKGYEGYYEVSDYGRVRSVEKVVNSSLRHNSTITRKPKILKPNTKKNGYLTVDLCKDNIKKTCQVHRLVANAFIEKPEFKNQVNHINCKTNDNRVTNLEWCTNKENIQHASSLGHMVCVFRKKILCIDINKCFDSSYKAAEWLNETKFHNEKRIDNMAKNIRACCCGKRNSAYGYRWKDLI